MRDKEQRERQRETEDVIPGMFETNSHDQQVPSLPPSPPPSLSPTHRDLRPRPAACRRPWLQRRLPRTRWSKGVSPPFLDDPDRSGGRSGRRPVDDRLTPARRKRKRKRKRRGRRRKKIRRRRIRMTKRWVTCCRYLTALIPGSYP